jgi:hypothetical protein
MYVMQVYYDADDGVGDSVVNILLIVMFVIQRSMDDDGDDKLQSNYSYLHM